MSPKLLVLAASLAASAPTDAPRRVENDAAARALCEATAPLSRHRARKPGDDEERAKRRSELLAATFEARLPMSALELDEVDEKGRALVFRRAGALRTTAGPQLHVEEREIELAVTDA